MHSAPSGVESDHSMETTDAVIHLPLNTLYIYDAIAGVSGGVSETSKRVSQAVHATDYVNVQ